MNNVEIGNYLIGLRTSLWDIRKKSNEYNIRNLLEIEINQMESIIFDIQEKINIKS